MNTLIEFVTESLGDNIAYSPYPSVYQKKHGGKVYVKTKWHNIFHTDNGNVLFVDKNTDIFYDKKYEINFYFVNQPIQKQICDQLGLEFSEIQPSIKSTSSFKITKKRKFVCIGVHSTSQMKYWNNTNGWNKTVKYLKAIGYDVFAIDKNEVFGIQGYWNRLPNGVINETGDYPIEYRIEQLKKCEFYIGLSSGLAWLAWALGKKVVMISGCTPEYNEFKNNCYRVINKNVCNGCLCDESIPNYQGITSGWLYCPRNKNFECSKSIDFSMVKEKIDQCIKDLK